MILLARTPTGLQLLSDGFVAFMKEMDLSPNLSKSYIMEVGKKFRKSNSYTVGTHTLGKVPDFSYLSILFDDKLSFKHLLEVKCLGLTKSTGASESFAHR